MTLRHFPINPTMGAAVIDGWSARSAYLEKCCSLSMIRIIPCGCSYAMPKGGYRSQRQVTGGGDMAQAPSPVTNISKAFSDD